MIVNKHPTRCGWGNAAGWTGASCFTERLLRDGFHQHATLDRRRPTMDIFKPLDIVFTQIAARLHFVDLEWNLARVAQTVNRSNRNVSRLDFAPTVVTVTSDSRQTSVLSIS